MNSFVSDRNLASRAVASFGVSTAAFTNVLFLLASPRHEAIFHWHGPISALFVPAMAEVLLLTLALTFFLSLVQNHASLRRSIWALLLGFLPLLITTSLRAAFGKGLSSREETILFLLCSLLFLLSSFVLSASLFERFQKAGYVFLLAMAFSGSLLIAEDIACWIAARHLDEAASLASTTTLPPPQKRPPVIWIVLDELAYKQAFLDRPADLSLPAMDALRAQSTLFTNVIPAADHTEVAIPSLLEGVPIKDVDIARDGQHLREQHDDGQWSTLEERDSVFADAQTKGYQTAAAVWYIPYCRLLPTVISRCVWSSQSSPLRGLFPSDSIGENIVHPWIRIWRRSPVFWLFPARRSEYKLRENEHLQDYLALSQASNELASSGQYDFLLLHLPVPHPGGIYDRRHKTYMPDTGSYVDNLALADIWMGSLRKILEANHQWEDATILVMGDHSWRTKSMWQKTGPWTAEDQLVSGNRFDSRPVYMLKLPQEHSPATINASYQAVHTRALLNALMDGKIQTPEELQQWVAER